MAIEDYAPIECFIFDSSDLTKISSNILNILLTTDGYEGTGVLPIKHFISPSSEVYSAEKITEITNIIGSQSQPAMWDKDSDDYANAIIGYDKDNHIISVQCLPWDIPGRLKKRLNSIQIMICENNNDSDHVYAKTAINKSLELICYILQQLSISTSDFNLEITSVFEEYYNKAFKTSETDENEKSTNEILSNLKEELDNIPGAENIQTKATIENISLASIVITLIDSIGNVTLEKENAIKQARLKYNILTDDQKSLVSNYNILENAESSFVIALINNIGNVTPGKENIITKASGAYNNLSSDQKSLVSNYNILEEAITALYNLKNAIDTTSAVPNIKNFYVNKQLITIKKNNKNTVKQTYNKFINENQLPFRQFVPLVQKTFMKLTGTGIDFYNQKLLPQETLEYLTGNNSIPQWNILEENLLSSLSFQDINNLKMNLWQTQNSNIVQVNQQTNTSIGSNYLTYPTKVMYITQTQAGHNSRKYYHTDYPWDEAGEGGKIWFYCPCNEMYISRIWHSNGPGDANIIWLTSSEEVYLANGQSKIVTIMIVHPDNVDMEGDKIYKDSKFTRGEQIIQAGQSGYAEGIHFHLSIGRDKVGDDMGIDGNGNLILEGGTIDTLKPNEAFWIDSNFTEIINSCGLDFKSLPLEQKEATSEDD